jgi:hypothetical protein
VVFSLLRIACSRNVANVSLCLSRPIRAVARHQRPPSSHRIVDFDSPASSHEGTDSEHTPGWSCGIAARYPQQEAIRRACSPRRIGGNKSVYPRRNRVFGKPRYSVFAFQQNSTCNATLCRQGFSIVNPEAGI